MKKILFITILPLIFGSAIADTNSTQGHSGDVTSITTNTKTLSTTKGGTEFGVGSTRIVTGGTQERGGELRSTTTRGSSEQSSGGVFITMPIDEK